MARRKKVEARRAQEDTPEVLAAKEARRKQFRRLATAAALETFGSLHCVSAWDVAGRMSEATQGTICVAARSPIGDDARRRVSALLAEWRQRPEAAGVLVRQKVNATVGG